MENKELISRAVSYAKQNATNTQISVGEIASNAGFSMDYFNRLFLAHTGFSVMAYVNYVRLKQAAVLLRNTEKSVLDIALESGYDSHEGFTKAFKKKYNLTPSEYRAEKKSKVLSWGEMVDKSVVAGFLYENPQFQEVAACEMIDYLLEKDAKRYGYLCAVIKNMGLVVAAEDGEMEKGFICIGDDRKGGYYLELVTDDFELLAKWLLTLSNISSFYTVSTPAKTREILAQHGFERALKETPLSVYSGLFKEVALPETLTIRPLTVADREFVLKWANGKRDGYINHLLNERHYLDEAVLEYGVFRDGELIAVVECGTDEVGGFKLNDCCRIRFGEAKAEDELYREIYSFVVNDVLRRGVLPFDNLQYGEYAQEHGGFTAVDMGFEVVMWGMSYR